MKRTVTPYQRTMNTRTTLRCRIRGHDFQFSRAAVEYEDGTSAPLCQRPRCNYLGERKDYRVPVEEVVLPYATSVNYLQTYMITEEP